MKFSNSPLQDFKLLPSKMHFPVRMRKMEMICKRHCMTILKNNWVFTAKSFYIYQRPKEAKKYTNLLFKLTHLWKERCPLLLNNHYLFIIIIINLLTHSFIYLESACVTAYVCGQRKAWETWFSFSTKWGLDLKVRSLGSVASAFIHQAILTTHPE